MPESVKIRAVVDTNVFISGLMGRTSPPSQIVDSWRGGLFVLVTSRYLIRELTAVFNLSEDCQARSSRTVGD